MVQVNNFRFKLSILFIFSILMVVGCAKKERDDYAALIIGKWQTEDGGYDEYFKDGTVRCSPSYMYFPGRGNILLEAAATWEIHHNKMKLTITESSMPDMIPVGSSWTETIISIDRKEMHIIDDSFGTEETLKRMD